MAAFFGNLRNMVIAGFVLARSCWSCFTSAIAGLRRRRAVLAVPDPLAAHHLRRDVDRPALVFQLRRDADHAENSRRAEARRWASYITPAALFWFRWAAMGTIVFGIVLAQLNGYLVQAYTLDCDRRASSMPKTICHRHRHVAGHDHVVQCLVRDLAQPAEGAEHRRQISRSVAPTTKAAAAKTAGMFSRINTHALDPHAVLHGGGGASVLSDGSMIEEPSGRPGGSFVGHACSLRRLRRRFAAPIRTAISPPCSRRRTSGRFCYALYAFNHEVARVAETRARADAGRDPAGMVARDGGGRARRQAAQSRCGARRWPRRWPRTICRQALFEAMIAARAFDSSPDIFRGFRGAGSLSRCDVGHADAAGGADSGRRTLTIWRARRASPMR